MMITVFYFLLQTSLLTQLNVHPLSTDPWLLNLHSRALSTLAEVILLQQQRERQQNGGSSQGSLWSGSGGKTPSETAIICIWARFIITLKHDIIDTAYMPSESDGKILFF